MSSKAALLVSVDPRSALSRVVGRLNAAHADLVRLLGEVLEDESWAIGGIRSPQHWLTCYAGLSHAAADDLVRVTRRTASLPALAEGLSSGDLSIGQAAVIARHTPDAFDNDVVGLAKSATVTQLRRALVRYEFPAQGPVDVVEVTDAESVSAAAPSPVPDVAPDRRDPNAMPPQLRTYGRDGRFHLEYDAPADIGALIQRAIAEAKDALWPGDRRSRWPTR